MHLAVVTSLNLMSLTILQIESLLRWSFTQFMLLNLCPQSLVAYGDFLQVVLTGFVFNRRLSMGEYETLLCYTHTLRDLMYHQAKRNMFQLHELSVTALVLHEKKDLWRFGTTTRD